MRNVNEKEQKIPPKELSSLMSAKSRVKYRTKPTRSIHDGIKGKNNAFRKRREGKGSKEGLVNENFLYSRLLTRLGFGGKGIGIGGKIRLRLPDAKSRGLQELQEVEIDRTI